MSKITQDAIRSYLQTHGSQECNTIATFFKVPSKYVASRLKQMFDRGYVVRNEARRLPSNNPVYVYCATSTPFVGKGGHHRRYDEKQDPALHTQDRALSPSGKKATLNLDATIDMLAQQLAAQVVGRIREHLANEITALTPEVQHPRIPAPLPQLAPPKPAAPRMKKVAIIGLIGHQAGIISSEYANCFDFKFITSDERSAKSIGSVRDYDHVFVMGGFISHDITNALKAQGTPFVFVNGGVTTLRDRLTDVYATA